MTKQRRRRNVYRTLLGYRRIVARNEERYEEMFSDISALIVAYRAQGDQ